MAQIGIAQRGSRVIERIVGPVCFIAGLAVNAADLRIREIPRHTEASQCNHHQRINDRKLIVQEMLAGDNFVSLGIAVFRRTVLDHIGDKYLLPLHVDQTQEIIQILAGTPHEGQTLPVLFGSRCLTDKQDVGAGIAVTGDAVIGRLVQAAVLADFDLFRQSVQLCGTVFGHNRLAPYESTMTIVTGYSGLATFC